MVVETHFHALTLLWGIQNKRKIWPGNCCYWATTKAKTTTLRIRDYAIPSIDMKLKPDSQTNLSIFWNIFKDYVLVDQHASEIRPKDPRYIACQLKAFCFVSGLKDMSRFLTYTGSKSTAKRNPLRVQRQHYKAILGLRHCSKSCQTSLAPVANLKGNQ